jgi:hypothetical protein
LAAIETTPPAGAPFFAWLPLAAGKPFFAWPTARVAIHRHRHTHIVFIKVPSLLGGEAIVPYNPARR